MIKRILQQEIENRIGIGKAILLIGARQVGKTTLLRTVLKNKRHLFLDGDNPSVKKLLTNPNTEELKSIIGSHNGTSSKLCVIDLFTNS